MQVNDVEHDAEGRWPIDATASRIDWLLPSPTFPAGYGLAIASSYANGREKISSVAATVVTVLATALAICFVIEFFRALAKYDPMP